MQITNTIESVREDARDIPRTSPDGDRRAVIVLTDWAAGLKQYGVQYWTQAMIDQGTQCNSDPARSTSTLVEVLEERRPGLKVR